MNSNNLFFRPPLFVLLLILLSCSESVDRSSEFPFSISENIQIIGHKGSGPINNLGNDRYHENGKPAVINALEKTDGTEIDIQMSKDSTLWLFHDHEIINCSDDLINFSNCSDVVLDSLNDCKFSGQLITLSQFNSLLKKFPKKIISLDLKVLSNPVITKSWKKEEAVSYIFNSIDSILSERDYLIEIPENISMTLAKKHTGQDVFKVIYEEESISKYSTSDNISMPFTIDSDSQDGFNKIQLWTPNTISEILKTIDQDPDIIQTDNIDLAEFIINVRDHHHPVCDSVIDINFTRSTEEYSSIIEDQPLPKGAKLFMLDIDEFKSGKEQYLVVAINNKNGDNIYWESNDITDPYPHLFMHSKYAKGMEASYSVYIWNKALNPLNIDAKLLMYNQ
tara:strand:- start:16372 stop:17553 length:1182 start_codon:yes stop_codon:yes gene_type:complete